MPLGVVTALEFDLIPLETVVAGYLAWDWNRVEEVMPAWVRVGGRMRRKPPRRRCAC